MYAGVYIVAHVRRAVLRGALNPRSTMAAMNADAITLGFAAAIAVVLITLVVLRIGRARAAHIALLDRGALAKGEIVRILQEPNGAYLVRYQFTPEGTQEPVTRDAYIGYLVAEVPEVGAQVRVRYDPKSPERSLLAREGTQP